MGTIIAVANQKGGVGKTTTAINLSACLAALGKMVMALDMDPQGNMTSGLGIDKNNVKYTIYDVMEGGADIDDAVCRDALENLDMIPANIDLAAAEIELAGAEDKEFIVHKEVEKIRSRYDYIVIDCPPSLNMLTINAMTTADKILVPIQCEYYALEGLSQLIHTIDLVKTRLNTDLNIDGIVFTMYDSRTNLSREVIENVRENLHLDIYDTIIPRNIRLAEAPSHGLPVHLYDPGSSGAESYMRLAKEVIDKGERKWQ